MPLLRGGIFVDDPYVELSDEADLPSDHAVPLLLTYNRANTQEAALRARGTPLGLIISGDSDPEAITSWLDIVELVDIRFDSFTNGRGFSVAHLLRDRYRFTGELRASGDILPDQIGFLRQVGIDSFSIDGDETELASWRSAAVSQTLTYQGSYMPQTGFGPRAIFNGRRHNQQQPTVYFDQS